MRAGRREEGDHGERGQIVIFAALMMVAVLGFAALVIDLGFSAETKRDAQNDADAMALAAVQDLATRGNSASLRQTNATSTANSWATANGVDPSEIKSIAYGTTCNGASVPDTVTVELTKTHETFLAGVLGVNTVPLEVCATARTGLARGGNLLLPIGILRDDPEVAGGICFYGDGAGNVQANFFYNATDGTDLTYATGGEDEKCVVKIRKPSHAEAWANGNTGPIRLDEQSQVDPNNYRPDCDPGNTNSGGAEYGENIEHGTDCPYAVGDSIRPLTGGQGGNTCSSIDARLANHTETDGPHDDHDITDVFMDPKPDPTIGGFVYTRVDVTNPHFAVMPVITSQGSGSSQWVTIQRFVTVYLVGCENSGGNGANALYTVTVIPVNSQFFVDGQDIVDPGDVDYTSDWPAYTIKLVN